MVKKNMVLLKWSHEFWLRTFALFFMVMLSTAWFSRNSWRQKSVHWMAIGIAVLGGLQMGWDLDQESS